MHKFSLDQSVGEIVVQLPKAAEVFQTLQIDFCCGGDKALSEAVAELSLAGEDVLAELDKAFAAAAELTNQINYSEMETADLVDYIINKHHAFLQLNLPQLSDLTTTILRVHGQHHPELFKVYQLFHELKLELDQHLIKEEVMLFPLMKEGAPKEKVAQVLAETEAEHDAAGEIIHELRKITNQYQAPADGCGTYHVTYAKLAELETDLFQHIHLENNLLFKRFI